MPNRKSETQYQYQYQLFNVAGVKCPWMPNILKAVISFILFKQRLNINAQGMLLMTIGMPNTKCSMNGDNDHKVNAESKAS